MNNPLVQPDPGLAIWAIIVFLVLLFFLAKFAWRPLLRSLEARRETIRKSLEDAQQARRELEQVTQDSARLVKSAHAEAESIVSKSRVDAEAIIREARRQIETEAGRALRQIRSEVADLSIAVASKLIQRNFSKEDNSSLIEETLRQMESGTRPS
jgi:F-type H+-transporting ATPase subunit b